MTQLQLKSLVHYDPITGVFTRLKKTQGATGLKFGSKEHKGYLSVKIHENMYKLHRLAWLYVYGEFPKNEIDHLNSIKDDNRIINLEDVTSEVNQARKKKRADNISGFIGVNLHKGKYVARLQSFGTRKHICQNDSALYCAKVREEYIEKYNLPHARNFV